MPGQARSIADIIREKKAQQSPLQAESPASRSVLSSEEIERMPAQLCLTRAKLEAFLKAAGDQPIGFDIETEQLWHGSKLVGASLAFLSPEPTAIYLPFEHRRGPNTQGINFCDLIGLIHDKPLVAFNALYECRWTWAKCRKALRIIGDASTLSKMLQDRFLGLKDLVEKHLNKKPLRLSDLLGENNYDFSVTDASDPKVLQYVTDDALNALLVEAVMCQHRTIQKSLTIYRLELELIPVLARAEAEGVYIDERKKDSQIIVFRQRLDVLEKSIFASMACPPFALNSTKKLAHQLFDVMKITPNPRFKSAKTGAFSTSTDALYSIKDQHDIIKDILAWKHNFAVYNNNLLHLHEFIHDSRLYTNFLPVGADATSRIYTKDSNFTALPTEVRECMACESDRTVVAYDFSAAELRIVAALAGEETLINAFRQGIDPHKMVYHKMTGTPISEISKEQREIGKVLNYANIYGGTPFSTARALNCTEAQAKTYREAYMAAIPKVATLIKAIQDECISTTYTKTMMGRRRRLPEVKSPDRFAVQRALRQSVNTAMQSSCGDLLKVAMLRTHKAMLQATDKWKDVYLICPVFDSCAYSVPSHLVDEFKQLLLATAVVQMPIKDSDEKLEMAIEIKTGPNWGFEVTIPSAEEPEEVV